MEYLIAFYLFIVIFIYIISSLHILFVIHKIKVQQVLLQSQPKCCKIKR